MSLHIHGNLDSQLAGKKLVARQVYSKYQSLCGVLGGVSEPEVYF